MIGKVFLSLVIVLGVAWIMSWSGPQPPAAASPPASLADPPPLGPVRIIAGTDSREYSPAVAYNWKHQEYLVVWKREGNIYGQRVNRLGHPIGPVPIHIAEGGGRYTPDVAYDPVRDRYLVVWEHDFSATNTDSNISGRYIPWENSSSAYTEFKITDWSGREESPAVAYSRGSEQYLVVMEHSGCIQGVLINADGSGIPNKLSIPCPAGSDGYWPEVAYSGPTRNQYLVTWYDLASHDVQGVRLDPVGNLLGPGVFDIAHSADDEETPGVAACKSADQYLVAWSTDDLAGNHSVRGRIIAGDGSLAPDFMIDYATVDIRKVMVACNDDIPQYLVVWERDNPAGTHYGLLAARVDPYGGQDAPFAVQAPAAADTNRWWPDVAGGQAPAWLVTWKVGWDGEPGSVRQDIEGRIVGASVHEQMLPLVTK